MENARKWGWLAVGLAAAVTAAGQAPAPHFTVVSIKTVSADYSNGSVTSAGLADPSTWRARNANIYLLIAQAYGPMLMSDPNRLIGVPKSLDNVAFDIEARIPPNAHAPDLRLMLRAMLAERFKLVLHTESRPLPAAVISVAPGGAKLTRDPDCEDPHRPMEVLPMSSRDAGDKPAARTIPCGSWSLQGSTAQTIMRRFHGVTMSEFADDMRRGELETVDHTGLQGAYDFTLSYPYEDPHDVPRDQWPGIDARNQRALMVAFEKELGLRISLDHPTKQPVTVYVVDHVEKATAN